MNYSVPDHIAARVEAWGIDADVVASAGKYLEQLMVVNQHTNLTAIRDVDEAWDRHILESFSLLRFLAAGDLKLADLGSGGGLPGIPLALGRPDIQITLVESVKKKAAFLRQMGQLLDMSNLQVLDCRIEDVGRNEHERGMYDVVTARALGSMAELVELALPLLKEGGRLLAVKGRQAKEEIDRAAPALKMLNGTIESVDVLPVESNDSVLVTVRKTGATPDRYPRRNGLPKKRPLQTPC